MSALRMRFALPLALLAACSGESGPTLRFVPADAICVVRCEGPGRLADSLAGTAVARFFGHPDFTGSFAPVLDFLREHDAKVMATLAAIFTSRCQATFGVCIGKQLSDFFVVAVFENLEPALLDVIEHAGRQQRRVSDVAGKYPAVDLGSGLCLTFPVAIEGVHLVFLGTDLERRIPEALQASGSRAFPQPKGFDGSCFALQVRPKEAFEILFESLAKAQKSDPAARAIRPVMTELGCDDIVSFSLVARPIGSRFALDVDLELAGKPRGVFACIEPLDPTRLPGLLDIVPRNAPFFGAQWYDFARIYALVARCIDVLPRELGVDGAHLEQQFFEWTKVRLREDLVAHLGDEVVSVSDIGNMSLEDTGDRQVDRVRESAEGQCVAIELRDAKAFEAALDKALRTRGLHAARRTEVHNGCRIHRLNVLGFLAVEYAITDRALLAALGPRPSATLRALVDEVAARARGRPAPPLAPRVMEALQAMPFPPTTLAVYDLVGILDQTGTMLRTQTGAETPAELDRLDLDPGERVLHGLLFELPRIARLLEAHGLQHAVSATGIRGRTWLGRIVW